MAELDTSVSPPAVHTVNSAAHTTTQSVTDPATATYVHARCTGPPADTTPIQPPIRAAHATGSPVDTKTNRRNRMQPQRPTAQHGQHAQHALTPEGTSPASAVAVCNNSSLPPIKQNASTNSNKQNVAGSRSTWPKSFSPPHKAADLPPPRHPHPHPHSHANVLHHSNPSVLYQAGAARVQPTAVPVPPLQQHLSDALGLTGTKISVSRMHVMHAYNAEPAATMKTHFELRAFKSHPPSQPQPRAPLSSHLHASHAYAQPPAPSLRVAQACALASGLPPPRVSSIYRTVSTLPLGSLSCKVPAHVQAPPQSNIAFSPVCAPMITPASTPVNAHAQVVVSAPANEQLRAPVNARVSAHLSALERALTNACQCALNSTRKAAFQAQGSTTTGAPVITPVSAPARSPVTIAPLADAPASAAVSAPGMTAAVSAYVSEPASALQSHSKSASQKAASMKERQTVAVRPSTKVPVSKNAIIKTRNTHLRTHVDMHEGVAAEEVDSEVVSGDDDALPRATVTGKRTSRCRSSVVGSGAGGAACREGPCCGSNSGRGRSSGEVAGSGCARRAAATGSAERARTLRPRRKQAVP